MLQLKTTLFAVLLAAGALGQGDVSEDCPNRATECPDVCGGAAQCPRFLNAECQVNPCHGLCTPSFMWKGKNVTDRCDVQRCVDRQCRGNRQCVEEIKPLSCPGNGTQCRQYIRTRCVLPRPPPPTDCSQLMCEPGMYCQERKEGRGVKCAIAQNCNQLMCSEGLSCSETAEGPVCTIEEKPTTTSSTPITCGDVVCREGECIHVSFTARNFSISLCLSSGAIKSILVLEDLMCPALLIPGCQGAEICTDIYQDGLFISPSCNNFTTNCTDDTSCALNETCLSVPHNLDVTFNSICISTETAFEFGDSCASGSKQCPAGLVCQDVTLDGENIGTSCDIPSPPQGLLASSCAEREPCDVDLECFEILIPGRGGLARCVDKE